jgi:urease accessory protein UreE
VEDGRALVVNIVPVECLVVSAQESADSIRLSYEVGNRHGPLFYDTASKLFYLPYDEPMERLLADLGFSVERKQARLLAEQRVGTALMSAGHSHGFEHGHVQGKGDGEHGGSSHG